MLPPVRGYRDNIAGAGRSEDGNDSLVLPLRGWICVQVDGSLYYTDSVLTSEVGASVIDAKASTWMQRRLVRAGSTEESCLASMTCSAAHTTVFSVATFL